jgi:hypothetical protein
MMGTSGGSHRPARRQEEHQVGGSEIAVIALVIAGAVAIVVPFVFRAPGRALRKRFVALGTLKGRTRKEIVKAAGQPASETALPDGRTLLQWRATGYHIALVFESNGRCFGVTHENGRRVVGSGPPAAPR